VVKTFECKIRTCCLAVSLLNAGPGRYRGKIATKLIMMQQALTSNHNFFDLAIAKNIKAHKPTSRYCNLK